MLDNRERNLEAISCIREDILERTSRKRAALLLAKRRSRRRFVIPFSAAAAVLLLLSVALILVRLLAVQAPIYTGMTLSSAPPTTVAEVEAADVLPLGAGNAYSGDYAWDRGEPGPFDRPVRDVLTPGQVGVDRYTAQCGEDVYVTVHFENPDAFEIMSFTLNGQKYTDYMFEPGSDLENVIVKVNVGNTPGVLQLTIDAVKYVDGERIKDVRMRGERTVEIGVYAEAAPTVSVREETVGFFSLAFTVDRSMHSVADVTDGSLQAVLYDGETLLQSVPVTEAQTRVTFDGLQPNTAYQYALVASYTGADGAQITEILTEKYVYTKAPVLFDGVAVGVQSVSFAYLWDAAANGHLTAVELYRGDARVRAIPVDTTALTDLEMGVSYTLIATYEVEGRTGSIRLDFTTNSTVSYTVCHYLEQFEGTGFVYELQESTTATAQLGSEIAPPVNSYEGFTSPAVQRYTATDGEMLTVNYYYYRVATTVMLHWDENEWELRLKYGMPIPEQEKAGYVFEGWYTAAGVRVDTIPAANTDLYARYAGGPGANELYYTENGDGTVTVTGLKDTAVYDLVLPAEINGMAVVAVSAEAFAGCTGITRAVLPDSVQTVGQAAFSGCTGLKQVQLGSGVTQVAIRAFEGCPALCELTVSAANTVYHDIENCLIRKADKVLVAGCTGSVIPQNGEVLCIGSYAFSGCGMTGMVVPDCVTAMESFAIYRCDKLAVLTLPAGLVHIESHAVSACAALTTLNYNATALADLSATHNIFHALGADTAPITVNIGANVTRIPANLFYGTTDMGTRVRSVFFAAGSRCTEIGASALRGMSKLTLATLPDSVSSIGADALRDCSNLQRINLPAALTALGADAFRGCKKVIAMQYNAVALPDFAGEHTTFYSLGSSGGGLSMVVGAAVKRIPANLFYGSHNMAAVESVRFVDGAVCSSIGARAFYGIYALEKVVLAPSVTVLEEGAFSNGLLSSFEGAGVTTVGENAFGGCPYLKTVKLPALVSLGEGAFFGCVKLAELTLGETLAQVGAKALGGCQITHVHLAANATVGADAFLSCKNLATVYFGGDAETFAALQATWEGTLPDTVTVYYYTAQAPAAGTVGNYWYHSPTGEILTYTGA